MADYTPAWVSKIQDWLSIPLSWTKPVFSLQWGWGTVDYPNPLNLRIKFFTDTESLYMNGLVFFGFQVALGLLPIQLGIIAWLLFLYGWHWWVLLLLISFANLMLRWGGPTASPAYVQTHIGWRPVDGRPVVVLRFQSDDSAQGGLSGGFLDGPK